VSTTLHQAGVIAYRVDHGQILVLLITSRDTGRWIIPKGNINAATPPSKAAEIEAYEEGGVKGTIEGSIPLGFYTYFKKHQSGEQSPTSVEVYLLRVAKQVKKWPEKRHRKLSWVPVADAIKLVEEPGVVPLLRRFSELKTDLISARSQGQDLAPNDHRSLCRCLKQTGGSDGWGSRASAAARAGVRY
jgi:8-oxo-dGTP pyrophosphatase MutT (NUDIX family)